MAVNKRIQRTIGRRLRGRQKSTGEEVPKGHSTADQETARRTENGVGIIRVGTGMLNLPGNLDDLSGKKTTTGPGRVVAVIVLLALILITLIALFVSQMPVKE